MPTLSKFGASSLVPSMVALAVILEIGPVIHCSDIRREDWFRNRQELGSMKVTEQIDAMEVSGCNPFKYLVVTRVTAATFMLPVLVFLADFICTHRWFYCAQFNCSDEPEIILMNSFSSIELTKLASTFKTFLFGFSIGVVGSYEGYNADRGRERWYRPLIQL
ncbi:MAG: ABC transporter permease [Ignavibacteria bacterium]